jgi:hypothetical protein
MTAKRQGTRRAIVRPMSGGGYLVTKDGVIAATSSRWLAGVVAMACNRRGGTWGDTEDAPAFDVFMRQGKQAKI